LQSSYGRTCISQRSAMPLRLTRRNQHPGVGAHIQDQALTPSPPTILTFTLPAISDETVDCTVTASVDATHFTVVAHGEVPPIWGVGVWTAVGETHVHTTVLSGAIELDAYGYGPGGVSVAPVSASTEVFHWPYYLDNCYGCWPVAPYGTVSTTGDPPRVTQLADTQPAESYPVGKTAAYPLTPADAGFRPYLVDGWLHCDSPSLLGVSSDAAELLAMLSGDDTSISALVVQKINGANYAAAGLVANITDWQGGTPKILCAANVTGPVLSRYDSVGGGATLYGTNTDVTVWHVAIYVFDGAAKTLSCYTNQGTAMAPTVLDVAELALTRLHFFVDNSDAAELSLWQGVLTPAQIVDQIESASIRWSPYTGDIPLS